MAAGSTIPVAGLISPQPLVTLGAGLLALVSLSLDLVRFRWPLLNRHYVRYLSPLLKRDEDRRITGATYMLIAGFLAFLLFNREIAVTCMFFLALGDPAAALVGVRLNGPRLFGKSPGGTLAFFAVSVLLLFGLTNFGGVNYHWSLLAGAGLAAMVELVPFGVDDNLAIPLISGAAMQLLSL